jgi:hypothetical protein
VADFWPVRQHQNLTMYLHVNKAIKQQYDTHTVPQIGRTAFHTSNRALLFRRTRKNTLAICCNLQLRPLRKSLVSQSLTPSSAKLLVLHHVFRYVYYSQSKSEHVTISLTLALIHEGKRELLHSQKQPQLQPTQTTICPTQQSRCTILQRPQVYSSHKLSTSSLLASRRSSYKVYEQPAETTKI